LTSLFSEFDDIMTRFNGCSAQDQGYISAISSAMAGQTNLTDLSKRDKNFMTEKERRQSLQDSMRSEMTRMLAKLPDENWWLLADLGKPRVGSWRCHYRLTLLSLCRAARILALTHQHRVTNKMTMQNLLMVFCPSLNLSPPFLRYLAENHATLFKVTASDSETVRHSKTIIVTSPSVTSMRSVRSPSPVHLDNDNDDSQQTDQSLTSPSSDTGRSKIKIPNIFTQDLDSSAAQKFSTPIADRFAREGPVEIKLREINCIVHHALPSSVEQAEISIEQVQATTFLSLSY
jgi:hypothetical protein